MIQSVNNQVATEPFKVKSVEVKVQSAYAKAETRDVLVKLKVVHAFANKDVVLMEGDHVFVRGDLSLSPLAKKEYPLDENGNKFILIPFDQVLLIDSERGNKI